MKTAFFGYSAIGARALRVLLDLGVPVVGVWTHADDPDENQWFASVARLAVEHGIDVQLVPARGPLGFDLEASVRDASPEALLSASYRRMLPGSVLDVPEKGSYNLHGSLLPRYRGRCPLNWVLVHGERETGMTLHHMTPKPDDGDIVGQARLAIGPDETAPELSLRLEDAVEDLLRTWWPRIAAGTAARHPQDLALASYFGGRRPDDGRIEWEWPRARIHDLVRAVTRPFPGAFADGAAGRVLVWKTRVPPAAELRGRVPELAPGEFFAPAGTAVTRWFAGAGDGVIEVLDGELPGGAAAPRRSS